MNKDLILKTASLAFIAIGTISVATAMAANIKKRRDEEETANAIIATEAIEDNFSGAAGRRKNRAKPVSPCRDNDGKPVPCDERRGGGRPISPTRGNELRRGRGRALGRKRSFWGGIFGGGSGGAVEANAGDPCAYGNRGAGSGTLYNTPSGGLACVSNQAEFL